MTIKVKRNGAWVTVANGKLAVDRGTVWNNPAKVYAKWNGVWVDSGYLPPAGTPGTPTITAWSYTSATVTWTAPVGGVTPTSYTVTLMNSSRGVISTQSVAAAATRTATFTVAADTRYIVTVTSVASGAASATSGDLRLSIGHPQVSVTNPVYGWSSVITSVRPTGPINQSSQGPGYPASNAFDNDGNTYWLSAGQLASTGPREWEYLNFNSLPGNRKLVSVSFNAPAGLQAYLGMFGAFNGSSTWFGALSFSEAQMAFSGYSWGDPTPITHFYVAAAPTSPEWREINVESFNYILSNFSLLQLTFTNLVSVLGSWRAQVNDIYLNYRDWVQTGTSTTVTVTELANTYW